MRAWRNLIGVAAGGVMLASAAAQAAPYWIAYEGDDFPENQGWERNTEFSFPDTPPPARSIDDGVFVLDTSASVDVSDLYSIIRAGMLDPDPQELFVVEWRLRVMSLFDTKHSGVTVLPDAGGLLGVTIGRDRVDIVDARSREERLALYIDPGIFHEYRLVSVGMERYEFFIDGRIAAAGRFWPIGNPESALAFGDTFRGGDTAGVGEWDYVRFGVTPVPEPSAIALILFGAFITIASTKPCTIPQERLVSGRVFARGYDS